MTYQNVQKIKYAQRIGFDVALFASILFFPWWAFVAMIFVGGLIFNVYFEAFIGGLFMDALYGTKSFSLYGFYLYFSAGSLALYFVTDILKKKIRFLE